MNKKSGLLMHTLPISLGMFISSNKSIGDLIAEREDLILSILPRDATIVERGQIQNHTSVDYTFLIKHPIFDGHILIIEQLEVHIPKEDSIETSKFTSAIRYINSDGTPATFI